MKLQRLLSLIRQAADNYQMIDQGDHIAVGISGGKDSLTLLWGLHSLQRFYPKSFSLSAITVDLGLGNLDLEPVKTLCHSFDIPYYVIPTDIGAVLFDIRKESNPCSLCAKMRRGGVNDLAVKNGCNKVALGHHNEDVLETFFLSLFYEGRLGCFSPVTYLSRKDIHVIRPLIYVAEGDIKGYANRAELPVVYNPCPMDGKSKRQDMKEFINSGQKNDKFFKKKILNAIQTGLPAWQKLNN